MTDSDAIHIRHCCVSYCKYGDDDCPVANGQSLPLYKCEFCTCIQMNPEAPKEADAWWAELGDEQKAHIFISNKLDET